MIKHASLIVVALAIAASVGCKPQPQSQPSDPLLQAIQAKERGSDLSYGEGQGQHLFMQYCATCHGDEGRGDGQNASNLVPPPPDLSIPKSARDAAYLTTVITRGSAAVGASPLSPPWGRRLTPQQIQYLVAYCRSLSRKKPT